MPQNLNFIPLSMEFIKYRSINTTHASIYDEKGNLIGHCFPLKPDSDKGSIMTIRESEGERGSFAHFCNNRDYRLDKYGEAPLMTIENQFSEKKKLFKLLNEDFICIRDFSFLVLNESLISFASLPYNEKWSDYIYMCTILYCETCGKRFKLLKQTYKMI